ncbi:MAG: MazG-like family protein [Thermomicrobiales bacterium]
MTTPVVLEDVAFERMRQDERWGEQNHEDFVWGAILGEEVGEVSRAMLEDRFGAGGNLRDELVQVAAVAIAWIECIDRRASR